MFILYLIAGIIAGFLAGLLGIGGGILFTPILFYIFTTGHVSDPVHWTIGSAMLCIFSASLSSVYRHYRQGNLRIPNGLKVGAAGIVGTFLGMQISDASFYDRQVFVVIFSVLMLFSSFMFFWNGRHATDIQAKQFHQDLGLTPALVTGFLGGTMASMAGVGGGVVMVPLMVLLFHINIHRTAGISSLAIAIITGVACLQYALLSPESAGMSGYSIGFVDFGTALPLSIGGMGGAFIGARLNPRFSRRFLQWIFAGIALFVAVKLLYSNFF